MKQVIFLLILTLILSACVGTTSLWGEYQTPTPIGGIPSSTVSAIEPISTDIFAPPIVAAPPTSTPTSLYDAFVTQPVTPTEPPTATFPSNSILYTAQSGDWLPAVASRFGVDASEITSPTQLPAQGFVNSGTLLIIPNRLDKTVEYTSALHLIPDSEIVFTSTATNFDIEMYVKNAGGYISTYREWLGSTAWTTGAQSIRRLAYENSINPRLLLAILDYESNWVHGKPVSDFRTKYPLGYENYANTGMFGQLTWAINQLNHGYYGWRAGKLHELTFKDNKTLRLDPTLNAGTVAFMFFFAQQHSLNEWYRIMDTTSGFPSFYQGMFGDPFARAEIQANFFPPNLTQPDLTLPFAPGNTWSFTGGPHSAWDMDINGPFAALDFAPRNEKSGCIVSSDWALAMSAGLVVGSDNGRVMVDMDGDGHEQTGWNIMYMHIASKDRVSVGDWVNAGDRIGHASCEGGVSTGTHTHIARKYNGEWMLADGPIPFVLSGWTAIAGDKPYLGKLVKGNKVITADIYGQAWSLITRNDNE